MSQKKVDERKQSKGDLLHAAKKQMKITVGVVALVLVAIGAIVSVTTYSSGYNKGRNVGKGEGYSAYQAYQEFLNKSSSAAAQTTTAEDDSKKEEDSKDEADTTKADETTSSDETTEDESKESEE